MWSLWKIFYHPKAQLDFLQTFASLLFLERSFLQQLQFFPLLRRPLTFLNFFSFLPCHVFERDPVVDHSL